MIIITVASYNGTPTPQRLAAQFDELGGNIGREHSPGGAHSVQPISRDHTITDANGKTYPDWAVEGTAVFAGDAAAFVGSLPACLERRNATFEEPPGT